MVSRFGQDELASVMNYLEIEQIKKRSFFGQLAEQIKGKGKYCNPRNLLEIEKNMGFFPVTNETLAQFAEYYIHELNPIEAHVV